MTQPTPPPEAHDNYVVSFKPTTGYDSPMLAIRGANAAEVSDKIEAARAVGLAALIGNFDADLKATYNLGFGMGATPVAHPSTVAQQGYSQPQPDQWSQPQPPQQQPPQGHYSGGPPPGPPGMTPPTCPHGVKSYVVGQYGPFWACPAQRNDPSRCKPEKVR